MNKSKRERDLYPAVQRLFRRQSLVFFEVPILSKRVDMLFTNNGLRNFYAVESKLEKWQTALKQAALNQLFTQYSFVALPESLVNRFDETVFDFFRHHGVGLIRVGNRAKIVVPAKRSDHLKTRRYRELKVILKTPSARLIQTINDLRQPAQALESLQARAN